MKEKEIEQQNLTEKYIKDLYRVIGDPLVLKTFKMPESEIAILQMVWNEQMTFANIAPKFNVTYERIRQLYESAVERLKRNIILTSQQWKVFEETKAANEDLSRENRELKRQIDSLPDEKKDMLVGDLTVLKIPIEKLDLTIRTFNALKHLKINTLGDLSEWSKSDLVNVKNFGTVSLKSLEVKLDKYKITLKD